MLGQIRDTQVQCSLSQLVLNDLSFSKNDSCSKNWSWSISFDDQVSSVRKSLSILSCISKIQWYFLLLSILNTAALCAKQLWYTKQSTIINPFRWPFNGQCTPGRNPDRSFCCIFIQKTWPFSRISMLLRFPPCWWSFGKMTVWSLSSLHHFFGKYLFCGMSLQESY